MPVTFSWRMDTSSSYTAGSGVCARYAPEGATMASFGLAVQQGTNMGITANASAIGGQEFCFTNTNQKQINFAGAANCGSSGKLSILLSYRALVPSAGQLFMIGGPRFINALQLYTDASGNMIFSATNENATAIITQTLTTSSTTKNTTTSTAFRDLLINFDMQTTTGALTWYIDASLMGSTAGSARFLTTTSTHLDTLAKALDPICFFQGTVVANQRGYFQEFVIWDETILPTNVTLVNPSTGVTSTGQSLNGASRTGFVDCSVLNGGAYTNPGISNVLSGTSYVFAGSTLSGTYSGGFTYTDPGVANVRANTNYIFANSTLTGTLSVPTPATGSAGTVDLNNLLETIQYCLEQANTTTGSPIDLSNSMTKRVQTIDKINPTKIRPQASLFPYVTCFITGKEIENQTFAKNQSTMKKLATVSIDIAGMVWNPILVTKDSDPADNDIHLLMENIELVLRSYDTLNSTCRWQFAEVVEYYDEEIDETSHLRAGIIRLKVKVDY